MNFQENVKEGIRSIKSNLLRTILTACIIAIGITALVGILTAIDGIKSSVDSSFSSLGANTFDIYRKMNTSRTTLGGKKDRSTPNLKREEVERFKATLSGALRTSLSTDVTYMGELKYGSKKTNPNSRVVAADENYLINVGYNLGEGRDFSYNEIQGGRPVAIIGEEIKKTLFEKNKAVGEYIQLFGQRYLVIGILNKTGSGFGGGSADRLVIIPFYNGIQYSGRKALDFDVKVMVNNPTELSAYMDEARGVMRMIRKDRPGDPDSFQLERSETLAESLDGITGNLRVGGFLFGFITLLGAAIGLVNIMLVSVTERTHEIGIRKALGATPFKIRLQFLMEAIVICVLGGIAGIILGIAIGNVVASFIGSKTFLVPWAWMLLGLIVCIVVGILSGFYPAYKASRLDPIESLRFE